MNATSDVTVDLQTMFLPTARHNSRILVVEDDLELRRWMKETLEEEGFRLQDAPDALTGIISLLTDGADVVVTDWKLPGYDGLRLLESAHKLAPGTPVVLMTAFPEPGFRDIVRRRGAFSLLEKPFRREELILHVTRALRLAGNQRS